ncbi:MAG TPA: hypothetical protein ENK48_03535 [Gammaproteobacteria bacterium]|nr:hypothetical protein [Gammaproteobacteria bacterium]
MTFSITQEESRAKRGSFSFVLGFFLVSALLMGGWSGEARAHKGHGGPLVTFVKKKEALRALLPHGAKILKRKQRLSDTAAEWAEKTYGVDLEQSLYTYYLARDRQSGRIVGGAIILKAGYRHGDMVVAVGLDGSGKLTGVGLNGLSEKYIPEFEGTVGKGLIDGYKGMSVADMVKKARAAAQGDKPSRVFASRVRDAAVLLAAFMNKAK